MGFDTLLQVIHAETVLLNEIHGFMKGILTDLMKRNKDAVQNGLDRYQKLSMSLAEAEAVRTKLYQSLCATYSSPVQNGLSALILKADASRRPAFTQALRDFKLMVGEVRSVSQALRVYSEAQILTLDSFMNEFLPKRSIGTYGQSGKQNLTERPVLINSLS